MPTKKRIQYRYTPTGQKAAMIDPDGGRFTYLYDNVKRLTTVINPQGERTSYAYDAAGRRTVKKLANGSRTSFTYNAASRITSVAHLKSDGSQQASFGYQYDKVGNRKGVVELDGSRVTYLYDAAYQLTGEHRTGTNPYRYTYTYDNRGNRTLKNLDGVRTTSAYDDANQLKWSDAPGGRTTYLFDANGNQEVVITPAGARTTNIWDYENRLIGVQHPDGSRETMAYDPDGKRAKHQTASETVKYVWDGKAYLLELDATGITVATYTNEPTQYGKLVSQRKAGATHYYLFDALGSTRLLTDSSQAIAESLLYDAWGNLIGSAPTMAVPFRWVGELGYLFVPATSDYYIRARIYQPGIGRWISQDPRRFNDGMNLYDMVLNRPIRLHDPSGRQLEGAIACQDEDACEECVQYARQNDDIVKALWVRLVADRPLKNRFGIGEFFRYDKSCRWNVKCKENPNPLGQGLGDWMRTEEELWLYWNTISYFPNADTEAEKCIGYIETLRHELVHQYHHCTEVSLIMNGNDCSICVCDELAAYTKSEQCKDGSIWRQLNPQLADERTCLLLSAMNSCFTECGGGTDDVLKDEAARIEADCTLGILE